MVGGPAHGQVLASPLVDLVIPESAKFDAFSTNLPAVPSRNHHYSAIEVGIFGRIYRTWRLGSMSDEEHAASAALALIDAANAEACRSL